MKIVITDGYGLNPGDLSWEPIQALGSLTVYVRSSPDEIVARCKDADVVLTNKVPLGADVLEHLPNLKLISVLATGFNIVDIDAAREKKITVCNVPDYSSFSVAQHTFAFILELCNQIGLHSGSVHRGDWVKSKDFSYALTPLIELQGKTLGLVGFGNIGQKTAEIGRAFGMRVLYHTPSKKQTDLAQYAGLEELFADSDFVSLHLPLKPGNREFVNGALLSKMKKSAFLINTARGQLIQEADLAEALNSGQIAGAALDVLSVEPPPAENPLLSAKNCIISPHTAWMSREARQRIISITAANIQAFRIGKGINVVS